MKRGITLSVTAVVLVVVLFFIFLFFLNKNFDIKNYTRGQESECLNDSDCVPAECCHSSSCVAFSDAPICDDIFCTQVCEPGTLDCGQGYCSCIKGECSAVIT